MAEAPIIDIVNLEKRYRSKNTDVFALQGINLAINKGDIFGVIGKKHLAPEWHEDGSCTVHPVLDLGLTLDERIGDGFYYSGTVRLLRKLLENPELLEQPFSTEVEY